MPRIVLLLSLTFFCLSARAQEQENKLVDRLLRPDMSLRNSAQDKKFIAVGATPIDKKFGARAFPARDPATLKSFSDVRSFSSKKFRSRKFPQADAKAGSRGAAFSKRFTTKESSLVRSAPEAGKVVKARDYVDNRPFLGQGTRQKILSQQNHPLTIDEVRELLNKNK